MSKKNGGSFVPVCLINVDKDGNVRKKGEPNKLGGNVMLGLCADHPKDGSQICLPFTVKTRPDGSQYIAVDLDIASEFIPPV